jgi:hypothetical protein
MNMYTEYQQENPSSRRLAPTTLPGVGQTPPSSLPQASTSPLSPAAAAGLVRRAFPA